MRENGSFLRVFESSRFEKVRDFLLYVEDGDGEFKVLLVLFNPLQRNFFRPGQDQSLGSGAVVIELSRRLDSSDRRATRGCK